MLAITSPPAGGSALQTAWVARALCLCCCHVGCTWCSNGGWEPRMRGRVPSAGFQEGFGKASARQFKAVALGCYHNMCTPS